eukprot:4073022-Alexandrium_andersonii.AAC.1
MGAGSASRSPAWLSRRPGRVSLVLRRARSRSLPPPCCAPRVALSLRSLLPPLVVPVSYTHLTLPTICSV